jgi:hypothetical protein
MKRTTIVLTAGFVFAATLASVPAQAQRVFVAGTGLDTNPCTFASPCRSFQHAHDVAPAGGEISVLDSAGYGPVAITKAISIVNPGGVEAGITPTAGGDAITINTSGDVQLRGLTIEGDESGLDGIAIAKTATSPTTLAIIDCVIRHFTHDGIYLQPNGALQISILNTIASNNGNDGIDLSPSGFGQINGVIDHSTATSNQTDGMNVYGANTLGGIQNGITIVNSVSANNGANGIKAFTSVAGLVTLVMVRDTTASYNGSAGFFANGTADLIFAHSEATANSEGIYINTNASGQSFGDNHIYGNLGGQDVLGTLGTIAFH